LFRWNIEGGGLFLSVFRLDFPIWISRTEEEVMDNVKTVRTIIKAFIDGDIPLLLSHVAEDVDWE
jgi:hypothetical protein